MFYLRLQGGEATALVGGTAIFILILISVLAHRQESFAEVTNYFIEGFQFGFKVFGPVIPIAAFFYLGDAGFVKIIGDYLPQASQGIVNDLGVALAHAVPLNNEVGRLRSRSSGRLLVLTAPGFPASRSPVRSLICFL